VKFKLDENLPTSATAVLAKRGHDVDTVPQDGLTGAPDPRMAAVASAEGRILITLDRAWGISVPTRRAAMPG
jgi:predicted nuclease of predicted toxin-antitoxin system